MRDRILIYLLLILVIPTIYGIEAIGKTQAKIISGNFLELVHIGNDQVNDDHIFSQICQHLNDTLLAKIRLNSELCLQVVPEIIVNETDSINTIGWNLVYNNDFFEVSFPDRLSFSIDLGKDGYLKIQNNEGDIPDIQNLARNYIFYPDSIDKRITTQIRHFDKIGEIEVSYVGAILNVQISGSNGLSTTDWKLFYSCLNELIDLFDDERNKMSFKVWEKEYATLSFEEKEKLIDITGYSIYIVFYSH